MRAKCCNWDWIEIVTLSTCFKIFSIKPAIVLNWAISNIKLPLVYLVAKERRGLYYHLWNTSDQGRWILHYTKMMEGPIASPQENPNHNANGYANQPDQNNDNNAPAGPPYAPNQPPNQPAPQQPPNQPAPQQPSPQQPVPNWLQPLLHQPAPQIIHQPMVIWSHFKPEVMDKPEEDAEAHLLHTNDWMQTHFWGKCKGQ